MAGSRIGSLLRCGNDEHALKERGGVLGSWKCRWREVCIWIGGACLRV